MSETQGERVIYLSRLYLKLIRAGAYDKAAKIKQERDALMSPKYKEINYEKVL